MRLFRRAGAHGGTGRDAPRGHINVLGVHTATQPPLGADTWVHARILETLDRSTHTVHAACVRDRDGVATPTYTELSGIEDMSVVLVDLGPERLHPRGWRSDIRTAWSALPAIPSVVRLARYIRNNDISILHTSDRPRDALVCVLLSRMTRARTIVHIHVHHNDWMGRVLRWAIAHADARIAVSDFVRSTLESADPGLHHSYTVLNAIDPAPWSQGDRTHAATTRAAIGVAADAPLILTVCRLFEEKGVRRLLHATATVRQEFPDVQLRVAGIDPTPEQSHLNLLRDTVRDLGLDEHVAFLGRRRDVADLMAAADVFAMPSYEEPFGLVYAEAMASGLPVVALDNGGTVEVVQHGVHGLLCDVDDADALAANLGRLLAEPQVRESMGRSGREHVEQNFRLERQASDVARIYRLVASKSATSTE